MADDSERATFCLVDKHRIYKTSAIRRVSLESLSLLGSSHEERLDIDNLKADRKLLAVIFITTVYTMLLLYRLFPHAAVLSLLLYRNWRQF